MSNQRAPATFGQESEQETGGRDRWPSRTGFYLAAVGSAVGFGNVWRFPSLAKDYGGGAFFIPFLLAFFLIGLPVLILEISLGQVFQTSNVGLFGYFHPRFRGVGLATVSCAFILAVYYSMLLAWVTHAFFDSFSNKEVWVGENASGSAALGYFYNNIIGMETLGEDLRPTRLVGKNVGYAAVVWITVWLALAFGMKWTGRLAYITMGMPIILLFIFLGKAVNLTGASAGIEEYIGKWDMSVLRDRPEVWSTAVTQIFFSLSITFGTMTAYGSHCPRGEPAFLNATVVGLSDVLFSFVSGFAVFAALGHLSYLEGVPIDDLPYKSFSLVFGTWPVVFGKLNGGIHWVRLLFFNLFLLGIDSAFSIIEAPISVALDYFHKKKQHVPKWMVVGVFCFVAYMLSWMYATDAGLIFLDAVDFYINFILLFVGFLETFAAGWIYGIERQMASLGAPVVMSYMLANFLPVGAACGFWFGLSDSSRVWSGFLVLFLGYIIGLIATFVLLNMRVATSDHLTTSSGFYELGLKHVMDLREELFGQQPSVYTVSVVWAFMIKQFIPHILLILFLNLSRSKNAYGNPVLGNYEGYVFWPFQLVGIGCLIFAGAMFLLGAFAPEVLEGADMTTLKETIHEPSKFEDNDSSEEIAAAKGVVTPVLVEAVA